MDDNSRSIRRGWRTNDGYFAFNGKLMLISLVIIVAVCLIIAFFHSYARWFHQQRRNRQQRLSRHRADYHVFDLGPNVRGAAGCDSNHKGLDRAILKSLPTFFYEPAAHDRPLECAVCLSEFGKNELGRILPKCNHRFHIDCIDMWFCSHGNCPLCRAPVKLVEDPVKPTVEVSISDPGPSSASGGDGAQTGGSPFASELVGVMVENRTTDPEYVNPNPDGGKELEDPGGRVGSEETKRDDNIPCKGY
ncbi:hypothetical protein NMG60_11035044 [Bertholletia excelsa]